MTGLLPLILLWMFNKRDASARAPWSTPSGPPMWPTPASPPPMPAFQAQPSATPSADPSRSSTPLADLHNAPPKIAKRKTAHAPSAKQAAMAAFKAKTTTLLKERLSASSVPVAALQKILIARGIAVAPDGLYGPRTASAWRTLAQRRQLAPTISRVGPKVAKVVTHTYEALAVPVIP